MILGLTVIGKVWLGILALVLLMMLFTLMIARERRFYEICRDLDRRIIFGLMFLSVAVPILVQAQFPETATKMSQDVFDEIEKLRPGDKVLMAWDFDPASEGELGPMATAFTYHCATKKLKLYYMTLWPAGPQMIENDINVIKKHFPKYQYGIDYVNLGYKPGYEGVIKVIVTNIRELFGTDKYGTSVQDIPMMEEIENIQQMPLIVNVSAGYAGTKEWVLYAVTPYPKRITLVAGNTGVQATGMYRYVPEQLPGLLAAIKGAAEYEELVMSAYPIPASEGGDYDTGRRRMGPQLVAHVLIIVLIVVANIIFFVGRKWEVAR